MTPASFSSEDAPIRAGWGWLLALGLGIMLVGFLALANPLTTGIATGFLLSMLLLVYGVGAIASGITAFSASAAWLEIILGLLALLAGGWRLFLGAMDLLLGGLLLFANAAASLAFLAILIGVSFLFKGLFLVMLALGLRRLSRG